jgi:hypothetical protein
MDCFGSVKCGYCRLCREKAKAARAEVGKALPPAVSPWDTKIEGRTHQVGTFFPENAWAFPGGTIDKPQGDKNDRGRDDVQAVPPRTD